MTTIHGPKIMKQVVIPEHTVEELDVDAYWHLDWTGDESPAGGFLYAKVGWPTLADAQRHHQLLHDAAQAGRSPIRNQQPKRRS